MIATRIPIDRDVIADFCKRHQIRRLALFGSVLRDDFRPDSDVDILVEFEPGRTPGWEFITLQDELSDLIGRKVDLNTPGFFGRHILKIVLDEARDLYVAA